MAMTYRKLLRDERDRRARRKLYLPKRRDTTAGLYRGEGYRGETQRLCIPQTMDSDARRGKRPLEPRPEGRHGKSYCCFNSNARDFARFGQLLLNNGQWDDRQLISPAYLAEATSPDTRLVYKDLGKPNHCYGFQYWILDYKGMKIPYMRGILGQYVFTLPEKNAVIVRLGHKRSDTYTADQHYPDDINTWLDAAMDLLQ